MNRSGSHDSGVSARLADLAAGESKLRLPALRRRLILDAAVRSAEGARRRSISQAQAPAPFGLPAYASVAVMALALLLVGGGYFWTPALVHSFPPSSAVHTDPLLVKVSQEGSNIVLEWQDGARATYTVRQAASAKEVREAAGVQVRGHRYVDRSPSDSKIVYYLVE